jgi:hypothetical protein
MYACIPENGGGFFAGVHDLNDLACISIDPPPPPYNSCIASCLKCLRLTRFLPLATANVYSLLPYLVLGNKPQGGKWVIIRAYRDGLCRMLDMNLGEISPLALW